MQVHKRDHPRVPASIPATLEFTNGDVAHATTANLSRAGVQIETDDEVRARLFPAIDQPAPRDRIRVMVRLSVDGPGHEHREHALPCEAVFARRTAERRYRVGLQFENPGADIAAFVAALVDPG